MRKLLFIGAAVLVAAPVIAQPAGYDDDAPYEAPLPQAMDEDEDWDAQDDDRDVRGRPAPPILNPGQVQVMGGAIDRLLGAVMDLPIGGIAAALDPYGRTRHDPRSTVRDMATRDDPYAEARIRAGVRGATRGVGAMSQALARVMPELERSIDQVGREIEAAMGEVDRGPR